LENQPSIFNHRRLEQSIPKRPLGRRFQKELEKGMRLSAKGGIQWCEMNQRGLFIMSRVNPSHSLEVQFWKISKEGHELKSREEKPDGRSSKEQELLDQSRLFVDDRVSLRRKVPIDDFERVSLIGYWSTEFERVKEHGKLCVRWRFPMGGVR
jgi:hypothetical protein